jgi:hypothetical protein
MVGEPTVPFTREKGMRLETEVTLELQNAATALDSARAELWALIEDSRPLPDEILQSAIRYWAAVRKLRLWLGEYGQLGVRLEARFDLRNEVLKNSGVEEEIDCGG